MTRRKNTILPIFIFIANNFPFLIQQFCMIFVSGFCRNFDLKKHMRKLHEGSPLPPHVAAATSPSSSSSSSMPSPLLPPPGPQPHHSPLMVQPGPLSPHSAFLARASLSPASLAACQRSLFPPYNVMMGGGPVAAALMHKIPNVL